MGFFTIEMSRLVGASGRVVAVDVESKMLDVLMRRAAKAGVAGQVDARVCAADSMGVTDLAGQVDFTLACAMVHELPDQGAFFQQAAQAMKSGSTLLLIEPSGHVSEQEFNGQLELAAAAGIEVVERPAIRRSHAALLKKA